MWWERLRHNILQSFSRHVPHLYGQCLCRAGVSLIPDTHFTQSGTKPADSTSKSLPSVTSPRLYCTWPSSRCRLAQAPVKLLLPWSVGYLIAEAICSKCMHHHAPLLLSDTWRLPPYALRIEFKFFHTLYTVLQVWLFPPFLAHWLHPRKPVSLAPWLCHTPSALPRPRASCSGCGGQCSISKCCALLSVHLAPVNLVELSSLFQGRLPWYY